MLVYINTGTGVSPTWAPIAYATSHKCSTSAETKQRVHKDLANSKWAKKVVTGFSQTITCDSLISTEAQKKSYDALNAAMKAGNPVLLKYSSTNIEQGDKYEQGEYIITSLERNDPANEDATMSATFENYGEITTMTEE